MCVHVLLSVLKSQTAHFTGGEGSLDMRRMDQKSPLKFERHGQKSATSNLSYAFSQSLFGEVGWMHSPPRPPPLSYCQLGRSRRHRGKTFTHARVLVFLIKYVTRVFPLYYKQITIQVQNSSDIVLSTIISHFPEQGAFRRLQKCI